MTVMSTALHAWVRRVKFFTIHRNDILYVRTGAISFEVKLRKTASTSRVTHFLHYTHIHEMEVY